MVLTVLGLIHCGGSHKLSETFTKCSQSSMNNTCYYLYFQSQTAKQWNTKKSILIPRPAANLVQRSVIDAATELVEVTAVKRKRLKRGECAFSVTMELTIYGRCQLFENAAANHASEQIYS
jgi:hypothetical protein